MLIQNLVSLLFSALLVYVAGRYLHHSLRYALADSEKFSLRQTLAEGGFALVFVLGPVLLIAVAGAFSPVFIFVRLIVLMAVFFWASHQAADADLKSGNREADFSAPKELLAWAGLVLAALLSIAAISQWQI